MQAVVDVPLNTMLADLDEGLRRLLRRELERHGFEGVEVAFDAPAREWSGQLSKPTVNLFLYDLRESEDRRPTDWGRGVANGRVSEARPPMVMECSYAVTAWTQAVEDEHRLLSQVLNILFAYQELPADVINGRLSGGPAIRGSVGRAKGDKSDFWNAVGGQYKVSLDYVVRITVESGARLERGPEVRTQTIRTRLLDGPPAALTELHRFGGTVRAGDDPCPDAWVALPELGAWTATGRDGRFRIDRVPPGRHRVVARTADGSEVAAEVQVPGQGADLVIGGAGSRKPAKRG